MPAIVLTGEQIAKQKMAATRQDSNAMELANRLCIAALSIHLRISFPYCYRTFADMSVGDLWIVLTIVYLEDKTFGKGRPGSIFAHPFLNDFPELRDTTAVRTDLYTVAVAKYFQAAFGTMDAFEPRKPLR